MAIMGACVKEDPLVMTYVTAVSFFRLLEILIGVDGGANSAGNKGAGVGATGATGAAAAATAGWQK